MAHWINHELQAKALLQCAVEGEAYNKPLSAAALRLALTQADQLLAKKDERPKQGLMFRFSNIRFNEPIILAGATIPHIVHFNECTFSGGFCINSAELKAIHFVGCTFKKTLCMEDVVIETQFRAECSKFKGENCDCIIYACCARPTSTRHKQISIYARDAEIGGCCSLRKCDIQHEAFFAGAEIGGVLDLTGTEFGGCSGMDQASTEWAFFAQNIEVKSSVYLRSVRCMLCCEEGFHTARGSQAGARTGSTTSGREQKPEEEQVSSQQSIRCKKGSAEALGICFDGAIIGGRIDAVDERQNSAEWFCLGKLSFRDAHVHGEVTFQVPDTSQGSHGCFYGIVDLSGSIFESSINFSSCHLKHGVKIYSSIIKEDLTFRETQFGSDQGNPSESVYLTGTRIDGALVFTGESHIPIVANGIRVGKDLFLGQYRPNGNNGSTSQYHTFTAKKYIRLDGARIRGYLDARGLRVEHKVDDIEHFHDYLRIEDYAIYAPLIEVNGHVYLGDGFVCEGAINLASSQIGGHLDFRGGSFKHKGERCLYLSLVEVGRSVLFGKRSKDGPDCVVEGGIRLMGAKIRGNLSFSGTSINAQGSRYGIDAADVRVDLNIRMNFDETFKTIFCCRKSVVLDRARVGGDLDCRGGLFAYEGECRSSDSATTQTGNNTPHNTEAPQNTEMSYYQYCLHAVGIKVEGNIYLGAFKNGNEAKQSQFNGPVNFALAKVGIRFDCTGGQFNSTGDRCLYAPQMDVGRRVVFERLAAKGIVDISGSKIGGDLDCAGAHLSGDTTHPRDPATKYSLIARGIRVDGSVYLNDCENPESTSGSEGNNKFKTNSTVDFGGAIVGGRFVLKGELGQQQQGQPEDASQLLTKATEGQSSEGAPESSGTLQHAQPFSASPSPAKEAMSQQGETGSVKEPMLILSASKIGWKLEIQESTAIHGSVKLTGASIVGDLEVAPNSGQVQIDGDFAAPKISVGNEVHLGKEASGATGEAHGGFIVTGNVDLSNSEIERTLKVNASFNRFIFRDGLVKGKFVLRSSVSDSFSQARCVADVSGAEIGGDLDCCSCKLGVSSNTHDGECYSLLAHGVKVGGDVRLGQSGNEMFSTQSVVDFGGAVIGGRFILKGNLGVQERGPSDSISLATPPQQDTQPAATQTEAAQSVSEISPQGQEQLNSAVAHTPDTAEDQPIPAPENGTQELPPPNDVLPPHESGANEQDSEPHEILKLSAARIGWNVEIHGESTIQGTVRLDGASIAGNLECREGEIEIKGNLKFSNIKVGHNIYLGNCSINSKDTTFGVDGDIDLSNSEIEHSLEVNACFNRFLLRNSVVKGQFVFKGALRKPPGSTPIPTGGTAKEKFPSLFRFLFRRFLFFRSGIFSFRWFLEDTARNEETCEPRIDLSHSSVHTWEDAYAVDLSSQQGSNRSNENYMAGLSREQLDRMREYQLEGFTYENFGNNLMNVIKNKPHWIGIWLNFSDVCRYQPQPYEHMANVLKKHGLDDAWAGTISAKRREFRQSNDFSIHTIIAISLFTFLSYFYLYRKVVQSESLPVLLFVFISIAFWWCLSTCLVHLLNWVKECTTLYKCFHSINLFLFRLFRLAFDSLTLHLPAHLAASPWRAPLYAVLIWLLAGSIYLATEDSAFAPAEGHLQFYIAKKDKADAPKATDDSSRVVKYHEPLDYSQNLPPGYPSFNPFIYALDNLVPFLELGQDDAWIPNSSDPYGRYLWYLNWFLMAAGIYLPTVVLGAITGIVKVEKL